MAYVDTQAREIILKVAFVGDPAACGASVRWLHESAGFDETRALVELQPEHEDETVLQFSCVLPETRADEYRYRLTLHALEGVPQVASQRLLVSKADGVIVLPPADLEELRANARRAGLDLEALPKVVGAPAGSDGPPRGLDPKTPVIAVDFSSGRGLVELVERLVPEVVRRVESTVDAPSVAAGTPVGYRRG
jgi:hypothetical protein